MADGRFGCEADVAGPATRSTRSLVPDPLPALDPVARYVGCPFRALILVATIWSLGAKDEG